MSVVDTKLTNDELEKIEELENNFIENGSDIKKNYIDRELDQMKKEMEEAERKSKMNNNE